MDAVQDARPAAESGNGRVPPEVGAEVAATWLAAMRRGDWEAAWQATDRIERPRRAAQARGGFVPGPEHLRWDGTPLAGRRVLVRCLHGLGDTLQFLRFLPLVQAQARELHFLVQPQLLDVLRGAPGLGAVANAWTDDPPPPHDVEIEVMELAYALRSTLAALPPPYAQLQLPAPAVQLPPGGGLRVGLLWAASDWDASRSLTLDLLAPVLRVPGVRFYSLQQGPAAADPALPRFGVEPLSDRTADIGQAGAAMRQLDLVIAVDGMPAHLAATLGRPTWVVLKHEADWRWMEARSDSPWYPAMRLFRQPWQGDWGGAVDEVARALRASIA